MYENIKNKNNNKKHEQDNIGRKRRQSCETEFVVGTQLPEREICFACLVIVEHKQINNLERKNAPVCCWIVVQYGKLFLVCMCV
jgi:hypothetical protein